MREKNKKNLYEQLKLKIKYKKKKKTSYFKIQIKKM